MGVGDRGVSKRVIDPPTDKFPGPKDFQSLVSRGGKCFRDGRLDINDIDTKRSPMGNKAGKVTSKLGGRNALPPKGKGASGECPESKQGFRA